MTMAVEALETRALGTTARLVVNGPVPAGALERLADELELVEQACSRFRPDSDLSRVNANSGRTVPVDPLLVHAVEIALRAARVTQGLVDPTIGNSLLLLGYDRDFASIANGTPARKLRAQRVPGWRGVVVDPVRSTVRVPGGVVLDLGATAKAFAADRTARRLADDFGSGVLVSLGGDIAVAGPAPKGGWPILVTDDHAAGLDAAGQTISVVSGGVATSSVSVRRWLQGDVARHHLIDPSTGLPVDGPWRTVSVAAGSCVDANVASTAAIVLGAEAPAFLRSRHLPSRITAHDGQVTLVAGWPEDLPPR